MKTRRSLLLLLLIPLAIPAIINLVDKGRGHPQNDTWYHAAPPGLDLSNFPQVNRDEIYHVHVIGSMFPKAETMLRQAPIHKLSTAQAFELTGRPFPKSRGKSPYLVRAVFFEGGSDEFRVCHKGKKLLVESGVLGSYSGPMKRQALVVALKDCPAEVFVTCWSAE